MSLIRIRVHNYISITCLVSAGVLFGASQVFAISGFSQSFKIVAGMDVSYGALVSMNDDGSNTVELANTDNASRLIGVIAKEPLLSSDDKDPPSVQVATDGLAGILVSDINGTVNSGDKIMPSPISGIGMKATSDATILGSAQSDWDSANSTVRTIINTKGDKQNVHISSVLAQINVTYYNFEKKQSLIPGFIQDFANKLAGKNVSPLRVLASSAIALLVFGSIIAVLHAAVKSSIISIGRNPLSASSVRKSLFQISGIAIISMVLGLVVIYLILTV